MPLESIGRRPESRDKPAARRMVPSPLLALSCCLQGEWMQESSAEEERSP